MSKLMYTMAIKKHQSANCRVQVYSDNTIALESYKTIVAIAYPIKGTDLYSVNPAGQYYFRDKVYSCTTARHISWFLEEYFPTIKYIDFKTLSIGDGVDSDLPLVAGARLAKELVNF